MAVVVERGEKKPGGRDGGRRDGVGMGSPSIKSSEDDEEAG